MLISGLFYKVPYQRKLLDLEPDQTNEEISRSSKNPVSIKVRNLKKTFRKFGGGHTIGLADFNVDICAGEITAIVGHTRSGKSVVLHSLIGMETIDSGTVEVFGYDIK